MQDTKWHIAAARILELEGGKTTDHAGPTNMGITLRFLSQNEAVDRDGDGFLDGDYDHDGDIDQDDLDRMTSVDALGIYKRHFWDRFNYSKLHTMDWVCVKTFDLAVNCGPRQAHKFLQRAAKAHAKEIWDDGIIGPKTLAAIASVPGPVLLAAMRSEAAGFYRLLSVKYPTYEIYLDGWLRRAYDI